jgi:hypothetical protein
LMVWTLEGACVLEGSESTPAYKFEESEYVGGCPEEFVSGVKYEEGDKVSIDRVVYVCREWPRSEMCKQIGYEPDGSYSEQAWNRLGYCEGKFNSVFSMKARLCLFYFLYNCTSAMNCRGLKCASRLDTSRTVRTLNKLGIVWVTAKVSSTPSLV